MSSNCSRKSLRKSWLFLPVSVSTLMALVTIGIGAGGCTLLVNREDVQCHNSSDCTRFSATAVCMAGVCQLPSADGGTPITPSTLGPGGCFSGSPSSDVEFYNRCTDSAYTPYDNCARLGLCAAGAYDPQALVAPPAVTVVAATPTPVTLPSVTCYDAALRPKVIFMQGSTNFTSFIQAMAPIVAQRGYTIVWQPTSSCAGAAAGGFDPTPGKNEMKNPTTTAQAFASFYDAQGTATPCALGSSPNTPDPGVGEITDIGQSDVFAASCGSNTTWVPGSASFAGVGHYLGPIQPMVFAVPPVKRRKQSCAQGQRGSPVCLRAQAVLLLARQRQCSGRDQSGGLVSGQGCHCALDAHGHAVLWAGGLAHGGG